MESIIRMATGPRNSSSHTEVLDALAARGRLRGLSRARGVDFTSNDYLALAGSPVLRDAAAAALARGVPVGAGGSRLLRGNHPEHEALEEEAASGLARWVMRGRDYAGALRAEKGHLLLVTLRHAEEVVRAADLSAPSGRDLLAEEKRLAKSLVDSLTGAFEPTEFHDDYQDKLRKLVEAKRKGKKLPKASKPKAKPKPKSLVDSLRGSLRAMGRS